MFGTVERNSQWAKNLSFIAAASQLVSQMLPLHTAVGNCDRKNFTNCSLQFDNYGPLFDSH